MIRSFLEAVISLDKCEERHVLQLVGTSNDPKSHPSCALDHFNRQKNDHSPQMLHFAIEKSAIMNQYQMYSVTHPLPDRWFLVSSKTR